MDGTINYDEIGLDGIVVNKYRTDRSDTNYGDLKIGDTLSFHFDVAGQTIEKTFAVPGLRFPVRPADIASVRVNVRRILRFRIISHYTTIIKILRAWYHPSIITIWH